MPENWSRLTVYFEEPFWVGVYQRCQSGALAVCKITFGAEPRDGEVYRYLLQNWHKLRFGPAVPEAKAAGRIKNPKRRQRVAKRQMEAAQGVGTRAQQALQMQREADKQAHRESAKARRRQEQQHQLALKQQKRKKKHRGH